MLFIRGYLPGKQYGGPTTSVYNFTEMMGDDFDLRVVCMDHDLNQKERYSGIRKGWNRVGKAKVFYISQKQNNYKFVGTMIKRFSPDLIYASSVMEIEFNFVMFQVARKNKIPVILVPRGDLCDWSIQLKAWKKLPFLKLMKSIGYFKNMYFQSTLQEETSNITKYLGVPKERIYNLENVPMVPLKREQYVKKQGRLKVLFISRIHKQKNLPYAIKVVNKAKCNIDLDIYGPVEEQEQWSQCLLEMQKSPSNIHIEYRGQLTPEEARQVYKDYDCFLFPTLCENYGHVIAEALANNVPIIISRGTTPWDDIETSGGGSAIPLNHAAGFVASLEKYAAMDENEYREVMENVYQYASEKMNINKIKCEYKLMIEDVLHHERVLQ